MTKATTVKSTLFLASLDGAQRVFEHVQATEEQVRLGPIRCKNRYQRWSKNDDDLRAVYLQCEKVAFESFSEFTYWRGWRGPDIWDWESRPLEELRREAAVAREREALDRCAAKAPAHSKQGGRL